MSRELYRGRSKKVQKMGRDGLVEQDRAAGEERRVGEKEADVSFGSERPVEERAADPARQRQRRQQARFRQEHPEQKTENSAVTDDWSAAPDMSVTDDAFPDADMSAPEIPDAAPSMRGAVDTPMLTPPPVRESEPIVIRRVRKPGEPDAKAPKEPESGNCLKYDGGRRIAPQDSPERTEDGAKPPPLRAAGDRPMAGRSPNGDAPRPARYFPDTGGRLQFDAERKPEAAPDSRAALKKQQARQFSGEAAKPERLHFENAKPLDSGGASMATAFNAPPEIRVISETAALSGVADDSDGEQTDAATDAIDAAVTLYHISSVLRPPGTRKTERKARLKFQKDAEKRVPEEKRRDSKADAQARQPDKDANAERTDDSEETSPDAEEKTVTDENGGRLQFERKKRPDSGATHEKPKRKQDAPIRYHDEPSEREAPPVNHSITRPEEKGRLQFEREEPPDSGVTSERPKRQQESPARYRDASAKEAPPVNGEHRPERRSEKTGRLNFEDAPSGAHEVRPAKKRTAPGIAVSAERSFRFENAPPGLDNASLPEPDADSPLSDLNEPAQFAETPSVNHNGERPLREDGGKLRFEVERKRDSVRDDGTVTKRKAARPIFDAPAETRNGDAVPGESVTQPFEADSATQNEVSVRPNVEEKRRPAIREDTGRLQFEGERIPETNVSRTTPKKQQVTRPVFDKPAQSENDIVPLESGAETAFPVPVTERRNAPAAYDNAPNHPGKRPGVHEDSGRLRFEGGEAPQSNITGTAAKRRTARPTPEAAPNRDANDKVSVSDKTAPLPDETRPAVRNAKRPASAKITDIPRRPQSVLALPEHGSAPTQHRETPAQSSRDQRKTASVFALPEHGETSNQYSETLVQNPCDEESVTPISALPERGAKPETPPQTPDTSSGKSRLKFDAKPPKLTDDSKSPRKAPRLLFGIGKSVTSAKKEKVEKVEAELVIESDASGAKRRQRLRFERQETPITVTLADSASDAGTEAKPEETELLTRTRPAKATTDAANSERNADAEASPPKRRRLQFEPEPKEFARREPDEGFTRNPPKREDGEKTDAPPKKPRLRFEDKPDDKEQEEQETRQTPSDAASQAAQVSENAIAARNAAAGNANDNVNAAMKSLLTHKDKEVIEAETRVEKARRKLEKAKSKIPSKRRVKLEKAYDSKTEKVRRRLKFEKVMLPEGAPTTPFPLRTIEGVGQSARMTLLLEGHRKIRETERQNVGVEAAHKGEMVAEQAAGHFLRWNRNRLRSKPYRAVRQAERALEKEQVNLEWRRNLQEHPELKRKRALTKWAQKQKIKRKYAAAAREAKKTEQHTQNILNASGQIVRSTAQRIIARKSVLATVALLGLIVLLFSAGLTSCMAMLSSSQSSYISISYMANEEDICESDLYYSEMETDLQIDIKETPHNRAKKSRRHTSAEK